MDEIFVERAFVDTGNKTFPDPRIAARMKPIALLVPMVKSAGHENLLGIGRFLRLLRGRTGAHQIFRKRANNSLG
jgi:hypothetical protein